MKQYKILLLGLAILFSVQTGWAQSDKPSKKEQRKIERAERKRLKEEARLRQQEMLIDLVEDKTYVLEANTLSNTYRQFQVSPTTNFVKVQGNRVVIQTGNSFSMGYNGLGGITLNGTINNYKYIEEKNGATVFIQFYDPVLGHSTLNLNVQSNGQARAMVIGNWGRRAIFQGQFVALEDARIFKGRSII